MKFAEYTEAMRNKKLGIPVDDEAITRFVARQPKICPVCWCQVFDPFGMTVVIHDAAKCVAHNEKIYRRNIPARTIAGIERLMTHNVEWP